MKCPMFETAMGINGKIVPIEFLTRERECLKEECAWWGTWTTEIGEGETGCCLPILTSIMSEIMYKMPTANQFTK